MDNFDSLIREALSQGVDVDSIASSFTTALNQIQKEQKEREKAAQLKQARRKEAITELQKTSISEDGIEGPVAHISWLTVMAHQDWDDKKILAFHAYISNVVQTAIDEFCNEESGVNLDFLQDAIEGLDKVLKACFGDKSPQQKQEKKKKEEKNKTLQSCEEYHFNFREKSDERAVRNFIKEFEENWWPRESVSEKSLG